MAGSYERSLLDRIPSAPALGRIKTVTKEKVYTDDRVLGVEVAGFKILFELLERFASAALDGLSGQKGVSVETTKVLGLLPNSIKGKLKRDPYLRLMSIVDFVAGMTDRRAVSVFQQITGQIFKT